MRLVNPVRGTVREVTDPRAVAYLRYNKGYWKIDDATCATRPERDPGEEDDRSPDDPEQQRVAPDDHLRPGPLPGGSEDRPVHPGD
jgi:hypothetical protein